MKNSAYAQSEKKQMMLKIIDILIVTIAFFFILYVFVMNQDFLLKTIIGSILAIIIIVYGSIMYETKKVLNDITDTDIQKIVLLSEQGKEMKEWSIKGKTSLLIGKSSTEQEADIDLSGTEYESLINYEHAVLNCVSGMWYIEDIDSVNGVGIKKSHKRVKNRLKYDNPSRINNGDIIYIANTRILVK
ncbi:FHA domain-containing protein [Lysinibacillus sp. NPDC048646]|uniref:FHA domain-containing protein n=1 Tax=Lysinibacillus sp. NPDC048646 TaxID=3390574 RepID=UPI003D015482